ncbi:virulence factor Mce family protein [Mycolicibacterium sphagni]|uniref:Mammalian cell entry protein n=1 Tax=Mycolicibacterium sphagni TaxID=1786 RepID=A0A255DCA5_9MYCO|nr:virulence factor Mce family protein [Mycolicibacterium sphagni]MCV7177742.1 MCE family protein [Mycolicibacterium sphagni]OYN74562.1 mammalian cell entry protein [Mycolicibacterium sphagni]
MRTLETPNRVKNGIAGILIILLVVAVGQSFSGIPQLFAQPTYYGQFTDSAGLNPGDKVRIAGMDVGEVKSLKIDGDHVLIGFDLGARQVGTESRLAIRTETILGKRVLEIEPRGNQKLRASAVLPVGQTTTPYQIYDAVFDVTKAAQGWDIDTVKRSLNVLSETIDQTYPHLSAALDGVARFSDTIGKRDEQFKQLLANANKVAAVLGNRSEQINRLAVNAQTLLAAVNERRNEIDYLLSNISELSAQFTGFVNDNPNLNHVLQQLNTISNVLVKHKTDLSDVLITASKFMGALAEAIGSGPYFKVLVVNLVPYQILQPWVDAAFKKRGIDPEEFWRNAGLPAFRFPDPNGQRQPNGAPPPAPSPLEGTPDHPGPAVGPGSPCSYTPPADGIPTAANPLPCAGLTDGPFGPVPGAYPATDVPISAPNPAAVPGPGVPSAAFPGELSPDVRGVPAPPLAPGPPGARTVPVAPTPGPATDIPGYAPPPNALIGPIPPPGPGPQVPPVGDLAPVDQGGGA